MIPFSKVRFNRIVTQCPHCYNTLKNEYPQFGGYFAVQHSTEYLAELSLAWRTDSGNGNLPKQTMTYHDSCYLGRYNQMYQQPRQLLQKAGIAIVEMVKHGPSSFCCGGGGGQMWMETDPATRINHRRLAQMMEVGASAVVTACPYCLFMFEDAIRSQGLTDQAQAFDIAEILAKQLDV